MSSSSDKRSHDESPERELWLSLDGDEMTGLLVVAG
jgi:hypothetical protein